jgi:hypothetical protein
MTALVVRNLGPLQYEPVHTAQRIIMRYADVGIRHSGCPRTWFCSVGTSRSENALQHRTSSVGGIL